MSGSGHPANFNKPLDSGLEARSQFSSLGEHKGVVNLNAEITNRALQLAAPEQKLAGPEMNLAQCLAPEILSHYAVGRVRPSQYVGHEAGAAPFCAQSQKDCAAACSCNKPEEPRHHKRRLWLRPARVLLDLISRR